MKITICGSIIATPQIKEIKVKLEKYGHTVEIPYMSQKILSGQVSFDDFKTEKEKNGDSKYRKLAENENVDLIKRYYHLIEDSDAIVVVNIDKNGQKNYIGGNSLLEMGFAYVLDKKIYLTNNIPEIGYKDEIVAMKPIILNNDLSKII
jgi:hypothetical protein